jgi:hypothetical protein
MAVRAPVRRPGFVPALMLPALLLGACASTPPDETDDLCAIFEEKDGWYRHAWRAQERWQIPVPTMMAFVHQESSYRARARPPRSKLFGVVPWTRPSSSFGYAQATKATWREYEDETGRHGADRNAFRDAIDFVAWYNAGSVRQLGIAPDDTYALYLAYHEGRGGYRRGTWKGKRWLRDTARRVDARSKQYARQLATCEHRLDRGPWWWPF